MTEGKTRLWSVHRGPAARRSSAWRLRCAVSARMQTSGMGMLRRERVVFGLTKASCLSTYCRARRTCKDAGVEVDVVPAQPKRFAATQAHGQRDRVEGKEPVIRHRAEQLLALLDGERLDLLGTANAAELVSRRCTIQRQSISHV